jgi:hypothetical protein
MIALFFELIIVIVTASVVALYAHASAMVTLISALFAGYAFTALVGLNWALRIRVPRLVPYVSATHLVAVTFLVWTAYNLRNSSLSTETVDNVRAFVLAMLSAEIMVFVDLLIAWRH